MSECEKCDGAGRTAVCGGMFGFQPCVRCDGTGLAEPFRLDLDDEQRRTLLDPELPEVCRGCETGDERLRLPGQFLCESCAAEHWDLDDLADVVAQVEADHQ